MHSVLAGERAHEAGYTQVLWLDGVEQKYLEEVGAMNIFFVIDDEIVTPELNGSILPGITRQSILTLGQEMGYKVEERPIAIEELVAGAESGKLEDDTRETLKAAIENHCTA